MIDTKKEADFQKFMLILKEHIEINNSEGLLTIHDKDQLYEKILPLTCDDFRVHYYKSHYFKNIGNESLAIKELKECLESLKNVRTDAKYLGHDNCSFLLFDGSMDYIIVNEQDVYFYAGETFALFGMQKESLEAYKQYQKVTRIKSHFEPWLYSFRPFNEYTLIDLINKEITLVHPKEFNDPFDSLIFHWIERLDKYCKEKKHVPIYKKSFDYYRVRSFVKDSAYNKAYNNTLMWSHYANEHKGFCIKYKFQKHFTEKANCIMSFRPITYKKKNEKVNVDISRIDNDLAFCTKYASWKYENEVRLIAYMPNEESHFVAVPMGEYCSIDSIYFGIRCETRTINTIKNILKNNDVSYFKMESQINDIHNLKAIPI